MARGGYFLKKCFDRYEEVTDIKPIKSQYIMNSRKVNVLASRNEYDRKLLKKYLEQFVENNYICVVDEGWYCSSQIMVQKTYGYNIEGYYLGIMGRKENDSFRGKGILFDIDESGKTTPLYGVFRTNCTFYEQLLSAPHGSTVLYKDTELGVIPITEWNTIEKSIYENKIVIMQDIILDYFTGISLWEGELTKYELSKYVLHSLLFAKISRIKLENQILEGWYDNLQDTSVKKFMEIKNVKVGLDIIYKPENYLRYFCKLKNLKTRYPIFRVVYPMLGIGIYTYCKLSILLKYRNVE